MREAPGECWKRIRWPTGSPAKGVNKNDREHARERFLSPSEQKRLREALDARDRELRKHHSVSDFVRTGASQITCTDLPDRC